MLDSPHSGTLYPPDFGYACDPAWLAETEDSYVDEVFGAAPALGVPLLKALFPRCYIDANRAEDDIDAALLDAPAPNARPGPRSALGVGLIRRVYKQSDPRPLYARTLTLREVERRLNLYYRPYHAALQALIDDTQRDFGCVFYLNCHSMPALAQTSNPLADIVLGDRDGTTCMPAFTAYAAECLKNMGYTVALNDPYKGVELVRRHGQPRKNRHALQIEVHRALYMDETTRRKTAGFESLHKNMRLFISQLIDFTKLNMADCAAD